MEANKADTNEIPIHQPHPSFQNHFSMEQEACLESDPDHLPYHNFQCLPPALYQELFVPHVHQSPIQGCRGHCPLLQHTVSLNLQLLHLLEPQLFPLNFGIVHLLNACASFSYYLLHPFWFEESSCRLKVES